MKYLLYILIAAFLLICSCQKDENEQPEQNEQKEQENEQDDVNYYSSKNIPNEGRMMDAADITKMGLYLMDIEVLGLSGFYIPAMYTNNYPRKGKEPVFANYSSVNMYAVFDKSGNGFVNDTTQYARDINDMVYEWYRHRTGFIIEEYRESGNSIEWPSFFTSYVNGGVQLACDKVLFGQQPGEDLSLHFKVTPPYYYLPIGREEMHAQYSFEDYELLRSGIRMTDFFTKDSWMQSSYLIRFMEEPAEQYDELTFTLKFPASMEHVREFIDSKYIGENAPMNVTDTTFIASFKAKFNWEENTGN